MYYELRASLHLAATLRPGSQLLAASLACCGEDAAIKRALLHVHTANTEALEFYSRKGFTVSDIQ
jgi:ribosomal protein S18 acetylase RimI-like enzyme